jgi:flagellar basal body-associated protein FliL
MSAQAGSGNRNTIIIIVVVVVLLCCCCLALSGAYYAFSQGMLNSITNGVVTPAPASQVLQNLLA